MFTQTAAISGLSCHRSVFWSSPPYIEMTENCHSNLLFHANYSLSWLAHIGIKIMEKRELIFIISLFSFKFFFCERLIISLLIFRVVWASTFVVWNHFDAEGWRNIFHLPSVMDYYKKMGSKEEQFLRWTLTDQREHKTYTTCDIALLPYAIMLFTTWSYWALTTCRGLLWFYFHRHPRVQYGV